MYENRKSTFIFDLKNTLPNEKTLPSKKKICRLNFVATTERNDNERTNILSKI